MPSCNFGTPTPQAAPEPVRTANKPPNRRPTTSSVPPGQMPRFDLIDDGALHGAFTPSPDATRPPTAEPRAVTRREQGSPLRRLALLRGVRVSMNGVVAEAPIALASPLREPGARPSVECQMPRALRSLRCSGMGGADGWRITLSVPAGMVTLASG